MTISPCMNSSLLLADKHKVEAMLSNLKEQAGSLMVAAAFGIVAAVSGNVAAAESYPTRAVRVVVPFAPGGGTDIIGRLVATRLSERLGQTFFVDNKPGANANIGSNFVAKAAPDGYTLLVASSNLTTNPHLLDSVPFDVMKDLVPVGLVANSPLLLTVHPSFPAKNIKEFINHAKTNPSAINFATYGSGSAPEVLGNLAQVDFTVVPYKGGGPAVLSTLMNETHAVFPSPGLVLPHIRENKLRPLAVAAKTRLAALPEVPTLAQEGLDLEMGFWFGVLAPAGTPASIVNQLNREIVLMLEDKELLNRFEREGTQAMGGSPAEFGQFMQADYDRWGKIVSALKANK